MAAAMIRTISSDAASTHTPIANGCSWVLTSGSVAAALATMPVPITDAKPVGPD